MIDLAFHSGTLTLSGVAELPEELADLALPDPRSGGFRAKACAYAEIVMALLRRRLPFTDSARNYAALENLQLRTALTPRPHQQRALEAWKRRDCRGVAALPTGAGKTFLAMLAIAHLRRPTLVLVPTIDLLAQWCGVIEKSFGIAPGMLGGGAHEVREITVSTYDSALLNLEFIGNRFALLIADECHHLPAKENRLCGEMCIAPFRLGLSATPEMDPEPAAVMRELLGDVVCQVDIAELAGNVLSDYVVRQIHVELTGEEAAEYTRNRAVYTGFLRRYGINFARASGWADFLIACARRPGGKEALRAFLAQRKIARAGRAKLEAVAELLLRHAGENVIIFTADNDAAYAIGRRFVLPVLTHHTKAAERKEFLDRFRTGEYPALVTSKVLNEGVDVPAAAVGIVVSGSGSVREHVQRLGRILRPAPGKAQAVLYELVSANTSEESISERRRAHSAYRRRK